ncbi:MAG: hypothetical protein WAW35_05530 [Sideroxyarcus sp.]
MLAKELDFASPASWLLHWVRPQPSFFNSLSEKPRHWWNYLPFDY